MPLMSKSEPEAERVTQPVRVGMGGPFCWEKAEAARQRGTSERRPRMAGILPPAARVRNGEFGEALPELFFRAEVRVEPFDLALSRPESGQVGRFDPQGMGFGVEDGFMEVDAVRIGEEQVEILEGFGEEEAFHVVALSF